MLPHYLLGSYAMQLQLYGKKIWVFRKHIDFRKSITGITSFISDNLKQNPQEAIFLFYNKNKDKIKHRVFQVKANNQLDLIMKRKKLEI